MNSFAKCDLFIMSSWENFYSQTEKRILKFGICVYNWEPFSYTPAIYDELVMDAESQGYDSFFVTDHFLRPHAPQNVTLRQHSTIEAWTLLSRLAARTKTIKLGTCVTPMPLRQPAILAKMVATVDILSEGRVIFGVGAGWDRPEFEAYSEWRDAGERVQMTREGIEFIKKLWTEDIVNYNGAFVKAKNVVLEPKPVQKGGPPFWIGAIQDKMLKMTADLGDAWFPGRAVGATLEHYSQAGVKIKEEAKKVGRKSPLFSLMGYFVEPNASLALPAIGTIDKAREMLQKYSELGCEHVAVMFFPVPKFKQMMKSFTRDVVPSFA
jgi:probable F420-dependent oxidoreductase